MKRSVCLTGLLGILLLALPGGHAQGEADPQLKLKGKSLAVYPVGVDHSGAPKQFHFNIRMAEFIGLLLEKGGMLPHVSSESVPVTPADSLSAVEEKIREFQVGRKIDAEYTLFVSFEGKATKTGPVVAKSCIVVTDRAGRTVWSREDTEFPDGEPDCPMTACVHVVNALRSVSDVEDYERPDAPRGAMAELMAERSGLPPNEEREAMEQRWKAVRGLLKNTTLTVYPFHVWGREEGSAESAKALAERLTLAGFAGTIPTNTDLHLIVKGDPNELRVLWDTARAFRGYLREHPADTDYALLVDVGAPPAVHHVHLILCEGSGEWVMVDLQNSHHPDFQLIDPHSLEDCVALSFLRLQARIEGPNED